MSGPYDPNQPPPYVPPGAEHSYSPPPPHPVFGSEGERIAPPVTYAPPAKRKSWPARHKILTAVLAVVGLLVVLGVVSATLGGKPTDVAAAQVTTPPLPPVPSEQAAANSSAAQETTPPPPPPTKAKPTAPPLTRSQEQAIGTAKDYLSYSHFSRKGLIEQLRFEKFSAADATFAVDHLTVNYNEQAAGTAREYLDEGHFSRGSLIEQLMFEGYTRAQAVYAADKVGL